MTPQLKKTPLLCACENKNTDIATFLIEKGANIEAVDDVSDIRPINFFV